MKRRKKNHRRALSRRKARKSRRKSRTPRTAKQYFSMSAEDQSTWDTVAHVISRMRTRRVSLPRASREFGIDPDVVKRFGRPALRKQKNGKFVARRSDKLFRLLTAVTEEGPRQIPTRDSNLASVIGTNTRMPSSGICRLATTPHSRSSKTRK